jgi:hypothetical protein
MCIAILKPANRTLTEEALRNCYNSNRDGAGFAYYDPEIQEVCIRKGYFDFNKFWEDFKNYQKFKCLVHFRVATHKAVNGLNCHPWRVNDNLVFIHNGTISGMNQNSDLSDTGNFCDQILKGLMDVYPDFYLTDQFKWLVENSISSFNKLIFLDAKGNHLIVQEKAGYWDQECWFSNKSYHSSVSGFKVVEEQVLPTPVKSTSTNLSLIKDDEIDADEEKKDEDANALDEPTDGAFDDEALNISDIEEKLKTDGMCEIFASEEDLDRVLAVINGNKSGDASKKDST